MKVVSIALFDAGKTDGSGQDYAAYLPSFVLANLNLHLRDEDWRLVIHVDGATLNGRYRKFLLDLYQRDLILLTHMTKAPLTAAMLWRMRPIFETTADWVWARDIDCLPMPRDRACMEQFMTLGAKYKCAVSTVHDSSSHAGIMGGLCGFHAPSFREITGWNRLDDLYRAAATTDAQWAQHGMDQVALNRLLMRPGGPRLLEHRYAGWHAGPGKHEARKPGIYPCGGVSALVPDVGVSKLSLELQAQADLLANHLGAAGYDHEAAWNFWSLYGDQNVFRTVTECLQ